MTENLVLSLSNVVKIGFHKKTTFFLEIFDEQEIFENSTEEFNSSRGCARLQKSAQETRTA